MKKSVKIFIAALVAVLMVGCGNNKEEAKEIVKKCTATTNDVTNGYKLEAKYTVYAKGNVAEKAITTETVISDSDEILDYFEETLKNTYSSMNETYGGYTNEITRENKTLISKTTVDYNKVDLQKLVNDNTAMKQYVNSDNKLLIDGLLSIYKGLGAICE